MRVDCALFSIYTPSALRVSVISSFFHHMHVRMILLTFLYFIVYFMCTSTLCVCSTHKFNCAYAELEKCKKTSHESITCIDSSHSL